MKPQHILKDKPHDNGARQNDISNDAIEGVLVIASIQNAWTKAWNSVELYTGRPFHCLGPERKGQKHIPYNRARAVKLQYCGPLPPARRSGGKMSR